MRILLGLIVGVGAVWGAGVTEPPQSTHCEQAGTIALSNHEVPIIVEDGSIRLRAYRSHFDKDLLAKALDPSPARLAPTKKKKALAEEQEEPIGKWHTHDGDHLLQIAVAVPNSAAQQAAGNPFRTQLHQFTLFSSDKVELELEQGNTVAESVWFSKEIAKTLSTKCHPAPKDEWEKLGWLMRAPGIVTKQNLKIPDTVEYVNLEYDPLSNKQGALRLRGVRVWSKKPGNSKRLTPKATFELGTGCASVQICPNDKDGKPVCLAMDPPCTLKRYTGRAGEKNEVLQK